jgi:hypothetical protein
MAQLMSMICSAHMLYNHRICWFRMYSGRFWFDHWHRVVQDFKTGSLNMSLTESIPVYFTTYLAECTIHSPSCLVYFVFVSYLAQQCIPHTCKMSEPILNFSSKFILWARISTLTEGFLTSWFNLDWQKPHDGPTEHVDKDSGAKRKPLHLFQIHPKDPNISPACSHRSGRRTGRPHIPATWLNIRSRFNLWTRISNFTWGILIST